MITRVKIKRCW